MSDLQHPKIDEAKLRLPMPGLLKHLELGAHVDTRANTQCPLCHRENAFALRENSDGNWFFECCVCGSGDEIMFLHKHLKITQFNAATRYLQMAGVLDAPQEPKNTPVPHVQSGNGAASVKGNAAKRPTENAALQGSAIMLPEIELWPDSVSGAHTLNEIAEAHLRYVALPPGGSDVLALWCAHCHLFGAFVCSPRLNISSPERGCGKTTLRDVVSLFVPRPVLTENLSVAVLFRLVHAYSPVILADEYDAWLKDNEELRGLLNAGHRRDAKVYRCEGDRHEVRGFYAYTPAVLCGIGALPGTLHDRAIVVRLERAKEKELCRKLARWCTDNRERIAACDPALPDGVFNRLADNWRPLIAIAEVAGGDWPKRITEAFKKLTLKTVDIKTFRVQLLADIREIIKEKENPATEKATKGGGIEEWLPSGDLIERLVAMPESPWGEANKAGKPINERWLALRLGDFGITPGRFSDKCDHRVRGYKVADCEEAFARYL